VFDGFSSVQLHLTGDSNLGRGAGDAIKPETLNILREKNARQVVESEGNYGHPLTNLAMVLEL
jgi:hypothetical protein